MSEHAARILLTCLAAHAALGVGFAAAFHAFGIARVDPAARGAGPGFRLLVTPGLVALWPVMAWRWWRGPRGTAANLSAPRRLRSAHRVLVHALLVLLPLLLAAALALRPPEAPPQRLPSALASSGGR